MRVLGRSIALFGISALIATAVVAPVSGSPAGPRVRWGGDFRITGTGDTAPPSGRFVSSIGDSSMAIRRPGSGGGGDGGLRTLRAARTPTLVGGFDAIGDIDGATPGDPTGALGDSYYLMAVNFSYALYDLDGVALVGPSPLNSLDPSLSGELAFDPKVVYDQYADTFVLVFVVQDDTPRTSLIVAAAVPDATAADIGTWCVSIFEGDMVAGDGAQWADYPGLGYDDDRVVITTNQFSFPSSSGTFRYAQVISVPKTILYDCTAELTWDVFGGTQTSNPDGSQAFTIQPAQSVGAGATDQFMLSFRPAGRDSFLTVWRIRETPTGLTLKKAGLFVGRTRIAYPATQGTADMLNEDLWWDPGDLRLVNAFYDWDRNRLYAAHTVRKNFTPDPVTLGYIEAAARWYEVAPASRLRSSLITRRGVIGQAEVEVGWPVVATDDSGNLFVGISRATGVTGEFLSAWAAEIPPGSTTATMTLTTAGAGLYDVSSGSERWGDYNGIGRDPADGSRIVIVNQYATAANGFQQTVDIVTHG